MQPSSAPNGQPVNALRPGDTVRRRHGRTPAQCAQVGRIERLLPQYGVAHGAYVPYARVRFAGTWRRFGGGRGDAVITIRLSELAAVPA